MNIELKTYFVPREEWPPGPWDNEPDHIVWVQDGYACEMKRHSLFGCWLGYVTLPEGHPWARLDYDVIPCEVHGGLTYKNDHKIGFDCGHAYDIQPGFCEGNHLMGAYRDASYVRAQIASLVEQAISAA